MTTKGANLTKKKVTKKVSIAKKKTAVLAYKISTPLFFN